MLTRLAIHKSCHLATSEKQQHLCEWPICCHLLNHLGDNVEGWAQERSGKKPTNPPFFSIAYSSELGSRKTQSSYLNGCTEIRNNEKLLALL